MPFFERYLTLWVALCIVAGIAVSSGSGLATVAGVLIEVTVMLSVVKIVNASKSWYERGSAVQRSGKAIGHAD